MLEAKRVSKIYTVRDKGGMEKTIYSVNNVDFKLENRDFSVLVGESGSGKSTLSRLLMGLIQPTSGEVLLDGRSIAPEKRLKPGEIYKKLQLVLQDSRSALDPHFTVYQSIREPLRNLLGLSAAEEKERILRLMEKMGLPEDLLERKPYELSGGQQKRVCIARALAAEPETIIFDEAVTGLDVIVRKRILDLLKQLHREREISFLFITHDMDVAYYLAEKIYVMDKGKIVESIHVK